MRQCRFIRPFLLSHPARPDLLQAARPPRADLHRPGARQVRRAADVRHDPLLHDEHRRLPRRVLRVGRHQGHFSGSGIIGTALGVYSPGTAYVLLHHYMGDVDGIVGAWGFARGGMGAVSKAIASSFKAAGGEIVTDAPVEHMIVKDGRVTGVATENGDEYHADIVVSNLDPKRTFTKIFDAEGPAARDRREGAQLEDPRLVRQAQHRARRPAGVPGARQGQSPRLRRHALPRFARDDGARLRRLEERHLVEGALPRPADPVDDRSDDGAAGQALHVGVRAVRAAVHRRPRLDGRGPRGLREHGDRPDRALQPELQVARPPRRDAARRASSRTRSGSPRATSSRASSRWTSCCSTGRSRATRSIAGR